LRKTQLTERIAKITKYPQNQVSEIISQLLEETNKSLLKGEEISFKNYFSLTRSKKLPSAIGKFCDKHNRQVNDFKRTNKGKGIGSFSKSSV
jgi:hypothetical protein